MKYLADSLAIVGFAAIIYGFYLIYVPLALIIPGLVLIFVGWKIECHRSG